ncbi:hypothetical protein [Pseudomonas putida]|uniref:Uncharacterized protein n=1 Tax=Pseudomonas putida TaxID=303 RepID=A0A2C5W250_PSEPU|nr:hypothetical protein [Pseudomonas putida]PHH39006.1 hypothetical protein CRX57_02080 [Pseudomonas putida]
MIKPGLRPEVALRIHRLEKLHEAADNEALLGIQQVVMLGELTVNRALDNLDPPTPSSLNIQASLLAKAADQPTLRLMTHRPSPAGWLQPGDRVTY